MAWRTGRTTALAAALAIFLGGQSCTGSDVLEANTGELVVRLNAAPAHQGEFQRARVTILQVLFRPLDAQANLPLDEPLGLFQFPTVANLRNPSAVVVSRFPLNAGAYRVERMVVAEFALSEVDEDTVEALSCTGDDVDTLRIGGQFEISNFGPAGTFSVPRAGQSTLDVTIDGQGLVAYLESLADCGSGSIEAPAPDQLVPFFSFL